jgi:hypothetical protein
MRLSYCFPEPDRIREGVRRLAGVVEEEIDLRHTFFTKPGRRPRIPGHLGDSPGPDVT